MLPGKLAAAMESRNWPLLQGCITYTESALDALAATAIVADVAEVVSAAVDVEPEVAERSFLHDTTPKAIAAAIQKIPAARNVVFINECFKWRNCEIF